MTQLKRQIIAVLAAGSTALSGLSPMAVAAELTITGNGSSSDNVIRVEQSNRTTVVQSNSAIVTNAVSNNSSTGGNRANDNTGGDVMIKTGDARSNTTIENKLNNNMAKVDCCEAEDLDVRISGNGSSSDNRVEVGNGKRGSETQVFQNNEAVVTNTVESEARTGENDARRNTGGDVTVRTGDASTNVTISTTANANVAVVGGEGHQRGSVSARIMGNGSRSNNEIRLEIGRDATIVQDNMADVLNAVASNARTGANRANDNTGGEVQIHTGNAKTMVGIDNMVNFNAADIDCGCLMDVEAKVAENGTDSDNRIRVTLGGDMEVFQGDEAGNVAVLTNLADSDAKSGENDAMYNTVAAGDDPSVMTGYAWSHTEVSNTGNLNVFGGSNWTWPMIEWHWSFAHLFAR